MEKGLYFEQQKQETTQMSTNRGAVNKYIVCSCHGVLHGNEKVPLTDAGDADSH